MAENNINEQLQGELSEEELNEIAGGKRIYNSKYKIFVDPETRIAYKRTYGSAGVFFYAKIPFKEEYLDGLKY